jgi:hypothetical protein
MICFQDKKASVCQSEAGIKSKVRGTDKGRFLVLSLFSIAEINLTIIIDYKYPILSQTQQRL